MGRHHVGRNDPCRCGSGRKYKHCCLPKDRRRASRPNPAQEVSDKLRKSIGDREFGSIEEAKAFIGQQMRALNRQPDDAFEGLSPDQLRLLLDTPFDATDVVAFPDVLRTEKPTAPSLDLLMHLFEAMGEDGLKATAKGNLPRSFCRDAAARYFREERHHFDLLAPDPAKLSSEEDFLDLHVTRYVARAAGLIRLHRKTYTPTKRARELLDRHGAAGIYPVLLRAFVTAFAWRSMDGYPPLGIVQQSWPFTAYLLTRHGGMPRPAAFYQDAFHRAFPFALDVALEEMEDTYWFASQDEPVDAVQDRVRHCYRVRALLRFAGFLGLASIERELGTTHVGNRYLVAATPLLGDAIRFRVGNGERPDS